MPDLLRHVARWSVPALWLPVPFLAGDALSLALRSWDTAPRTVASGLAWAAWAAVLTASMVPHPASLTAIRLALPAALLVVGGAAIGSALVDAATVAGTMMVVAATVMAFAPAVSMVHVNGPAYPNERRFPLRAPRALVVGPLLAAWALLVSAVVAPPLLLAHRQWIAGAASLAVAGPLVWLLGRSFYGLARRWLVFVPAGVVLHDAMALADPVLFRTQVVETLRAAPPGSDSLDLTKGAGGLALELVLREKVPMVLTTPGRRGGESGSSARLLFAPTRPGEVLAFATGRRIRVD